MQSKIQLLDIVALIEDIPKRSLARGQVGTVVEELSAQTVLVEFCDDQGQTYEICHLAKEVLMGLHFEPSEKKLMSSV